MKQLTFLRHGRTEWNHTGRWQGQTDVTLDDVGREQARAVAPALTGFSVIWASDLKRAHETATIVAGEQPVHLDMRLRERCLGGAEGMDGVEARERFSGVPVALDVTSDLTGIPGAETYADVQARGTAAAQEILGMLGESDHALAASHGGLIRGALAGLLGWTPEIVAATKGLANCHTATVEQLPTGRVRLVSYGVLPISHP